ncbi:MAG: FlgD immunoglobulin-like domain containing protein [Candidatus Krumholzibacteria bacterium]|nr:FlgD immunoglobulin-like domain containing protein [Candidatus Krumholzibacteria bacterium]
MRKSPAKPILALALLLITTLWSGSVRAGTGFAVSGPASIDTKFPIIQVVDPLPNTVLQGGQMIVLNWPLSDDNPNADPAANVAEMWLGDVLAESLAFSPGTAQHAWNWTGPDAGQAPIFALPAPTPFNPMTRLNFSLREAGPVKVTVHDARGFLIDTLLHNHQPAGSLSLRWNGTDKSGRRQTGGTYFFGLEYPFEGQTRHLVRKAVLLP